ncbi:acyl carrier protein [Streptomyces sp. PKU-EA00015]|uniref:acyl carrier protein n=1 Tax=unclassified Streptomyces TaxID=2593676 RepID=UPI0015A38BB0|nr:acyl carrier protein [Streptomyces sp. PKU-EA00015]NWF30217.1 acyl carrier protein [Streptomyces sp. PKU-EA00015]
MEEVINWIRSKNPDLQTEITGDTDLIESRLIASVSFLEFVALLEELSGEPIDVGSLDVSDFRTLDRISAKFLMPVG